LGGGSQAGTATEVHAAGGGGRDTGGGFELVDVHGDHHGGR